MDIVSPLPIAATQNKFLLMTIDYFNKWVEVEAYASIKDKDVTKFVWKKTSYVDLEFHKQLLRTMSHSLTVLSSEHSAWS